MTLNDLTVSVRQASTCARSRRATLEVKHSRLLTLSIPELCIASTDRRSHAIGNALTALVARLMAPLLGQASTELVFVQISIANRVRRWLYLANEALVIDLDWKDLRMVPLIVLLTCIEGMFLHQMLLGGAIRSGVRLHVIRDLWVNDLNLVLVMVARLWRVALSESLPFLSSDTSTCATNLHAGRYHDMVPLIFLLINRALSVLLNKLAEVHGRRVRCAAVGKSLIVAATIVDTLAILLV